MKTTNQAIINAFYNGNNASFYAIIYPVSGGTFEIESRNLVRGGFSYNAKSVNSGKYEIGNVIAAECEIEFYKEGYSVIPDFDGAECEVSLKISGTNPVKTCRIGEFVIDEAEERIETIKLFCLDRLVLLDTPAPRQNWGYIFNMFDAILNITGSDHRSYLPSYVSSILDDYYGADTFPNGTTYRDILHYIAEITGTNAVMSYYNDTDEDIPMLKLVNPFPNRNYKNFDIIPSRRFSMQEKTDGQQISKVEIIMKNGLIKSYGDDSGYIITIRNNPLIPNVEAKCESLARALLNSFGDEYIPFTSETVPLPFVDPMDVVEITRNDGTTFRSSVTSCSFTINGSSVIESYAQSKSESERATPQYTPGINTNFEMSQQSFGTINAHGAINGISIYTETVGDKKRIVIENPNDATLNGGVYLKGDVLFDYLLGVQSLKGVIQEIDASLSNLIIEAENHGWNV